MRGFIGSQVQNDCARGAQSLRGALITYRAARWDPVGACENRCSARAPSDRRVSHPRGDYLLPTTYYLLPSTYYLIQTTFYLLPTTYYLLPTTCYLLPTAYCPTYYLLPTTYYLLPTTYICYLLPTT